MTSWDLLARQSQYNVRKLADLCQVSIRTLQRRFATDFGITAREWLRAQQMDEAYKRLAAGETVKYVAYDIGFKQLSHFSRAFKDHFGVPPSMLAQTLEKKNDSVIEAQYSLSA